MPPPLSTVRRCGNVEFGRWFLRPSAPVTAVVQSTTSRAIWSVSSATRWIKRCDLTPRTGNALYGASTKRLNIPAFDGFNEVNVLKTPHHPDFRLDWQEEVVTVALATSAAPTFFSTYRNGTRHFADGGVWANNPIMVALVDTLSCFDVDRHKIDILSLGCGDLDIKMTEGQITRGGLFHWKTIIESAMHLQSQNALGQAGLLVGRERLIRLSSPPSLTPIALDDFERARDELPSQARRLVEENSERLEEFFDAPRPAVQFYHGPMKQP